MHHRKALLLVAIRYQSANRTSWSASRYSPSREECYLLSLSLLKDSAWHRRDRFSLLGPAMSNRRSGQVLLQQVCRSP